MKSVTPIVLFDGVCKFCNASVNWLVDHDGHGRLKFAPLQSATGQHLLKKFHLPTRNFDTLILVEGEQYWQRSTAALRLTRYLDGWWPLAQMGLLMPAFLRDPAYDLLASNRYRWFGRLDACRVPTPALRGRFLD